MDINYYLYVCIFVQVQIVYSAYIQWSAYLDLQ